MHLDIKKLGRISLVGHRIHGDRRRRTHGRGWEDVHVVERILTDNGSCYRALPFGEQALALGIGQRFTRPNRPQTNGKAERFIRTLINERAYNRAYARSGWRTRALSVLLQHGAPAERARPPDPGDAARPVSVNNVLSHYN
ncbi:hypothetical protein Strain138_000486 [Pseudogemmatithrix spongiicola]|uniref:Integrase catalytic domain-containing protein n=1 Tax=Pseudogemmatithrix spongiicola TaxID=3062599 RepID=A0AA49Q7J9_9BACT|nr:hypothetical protein Strain138_000486 [Gemmatimonadaceae bacterium 'strain 138']WKW14160.1 hypothetical protein Strain318_000486 [Gemmatimonadaceae bacterium 'strain 318']